ncbi:MAG TPA: DNA replication and repair protein RecF [Candidatus Limnocylindria bacterium]|nr:DNA replication and repair protein RecF [Candidatus Limnocylindria bacterium]
MRVSKLALEDFRSYARVELPLAHGTVAFVGPNGAGKTNVLEAIHLIARGDSPRARDDTEMVRWGATTARVGTEVDRAEDHRRIETVLFAPPVGERRRPRRYLLDGAAKRSEEATGELVVVAFFPEDVELLGAAPSARRRFLDAMLGQIDRAHRREMREIQRVLEQRNALLRVARDELELPEEEMAFWDRELVRLSAMISLRRSRLVAELSAPFVAATELFTGAEGLALAYAGQVEGPTLEERAIAYERLLREKRDRERWQGASMVGPQRDDLIVTSAGRMLPSFASRGEHRSAVLSLKIAEAAWLASRVGEQPVFLLDDVLSELDPARREALAHAIPEDAQSLITTAMTTALPDVLRERATLVPVRRGDVG